MQSYRRKEFTNYFDMIQVYYLFTKNLSESDFDSLPSQLSEYLKLKLAGYRKPQDRCLLLASQALLSKILTEKGYNKYTINRLKIKSTGRPFFEGVSFDFNISHTDGCVALVFSEECRVGIDIERIKAIDFSDFKELFYQEQWNKIYSSKDKNKTFYYYWTLMESAVKADGRGLSLISSNKIEIINDQVIIDGKAWFSDQPNFDSSIACCVTSNKENESLVLREIQIM